MEYTSYNYNAYLENTIFLKEDLEENKGKKLKDKLVSFVKKVFNFLKNTFLNAISRIVVFVLKIVKSKRKFKVRNDFDDITSQASVLTTLYEKYLKYVKMVLDLAPTSSEIFEKMEEKFEEEKDKLEDIVGEKYEFVEKDATQFTKNYKTLNTTRKKISKVVNKLGKISRIFGPSMIPSGVNANFTPKLLKDVLGKVITHGKEILKVLAYQYNTLLRGVISKNANKYEDEK